MLFALLFPLLETVGGYYYDFFELFFFFLAVWLALNGYLMVLFLMVPFAELNKESFLFFLPTLFPFLYQKFGLKKSVFFILSSMFIAGLIYLYVKQIYAGNSGGMLQIHLLKHLNSFFDLKSYSQSEITYGIKNGKDMHYLYILFFLWIATNTWKKVPKLWIQHAYIALAINIPLYILFCAPGELRNLSILYMSFCAMLSGYIYQVINSPDSNKITKLVK